MSYPGVRFVRVAMAESLDRLYISDLDIMGYNGPPVQ